MKKLNLGNINAGLSTIKELANENAGIARDELIDVSLIDFANKNTYAANDTDDSIRDLADQIETVGLLNPLGVIQSGNRYKLFSGERRYRAITQYLHWDKIPCRIFEGVSAGRAQLMLHIANGGRDYTAEQKLTLYAHQTKRVAKVGESVSAGDLIGYVGSTGDSTGNHLHFEIRYNDNRLDPLQFFE